MKLYTEKQIISVFEKYGKMSAINARNILDLIKPIELPSDEEIESEASDFVKKYRGTTYEKSAFVLGAKWFKEQTTKTK